MSTNAEVDTALHRLYDTILVLDFGTPYAGLLTKQIRECKVYAEMLPCTQKVADLAWRPKGVILCGSPLSVYENDASHVDPEFLKLGVPVLGVCYGMQEPAYQRELPKCIESKYRLEDLEVAKVFNCVDRLFDGLPEDVRVWMCCGDTLNKLPEGFITIATTKSAPYAAISHETKPIYVIQFHPEVTDIFECVFLKNFAVAICGARESWTMGNFAEIAITRIRWLVDARWLVIGAVSNSIDSFVAAKLMHVALGGRFRAFLVDNGCLRLNDANEAYSRFTKDLGITTLESDISKQFVARLEGITDPEAKRKLIGDEFVKLLEESAQRWETIVAETRAATGVAIVGERTLWFRPGTLYSDVIGSISFKGPSPTKKTHYNMGGLPMRTTEGHGREMSEPLRDLFLDEVRELGRVLHIDKDLVEQHPCPWAGLAMRVLGEVTPERLEVIRQADFRFISILYEYEWYNKMEQAFAVLDPSRAVVVGGSQQVHGYIVILRATASSDFKMVKPLLIYSDVVDDVATLITDEVAGVCRVFCDYTSTSPDAGHTVYDLTGQEDCE